MISLTIAQITLGSGVAMGLGSLISPSWASGVVRLIADPSEDKPGGYSEFRATYGGLLFLLHLTALLLTFNDDLSFETKGLIILPLGMAWIGAGIGRAISFAADKNLNRGNGLILTWIPLEFTLGVLIALPVISSFIT